MWNASVAGQSHKIDLKSIPIGKTTEQIFSKPFLINGLPSAEAKYVEETRTLNNVTYINFFGMRLRDFLDEIL